MRVPQSMDINQWALMAPKVPLQKIPPILFAPSALQDTNCFWHHFWRLWRPKCIPLNFLAPSALENFVFDTTLSE